MDSPPSAYHTELGRKLVRNELKRSCVTIYLLLEVIVVGVQV